VIGYVGVRVQRLVRYLPDDTVIDVPPNWFCDGVNALNVLTMAYLPTVWSAWPPVCPSFKTWASNLWCADRRRTGSPRDEGAGAAAGAGRWAGCQRTDGPTENLHCDPMPAAV